MKPIDVPIAELILDPRLQMRVKLDFTAIDEYAEHLDDLPPCKAVREGEVIWLTSGWHRVNAYQKQDRDTVPCFVRDGSFLDALVEAVGENPDHGIRRTPEDKARAVMALLTEPTWADKSNRMVAAACKVNEHFVAKVRSELAPTDVGETTDQTECLGRAHARTSTESEKSQGKSTPAPETRTDSMGRQQPATKTKILCERCKRIGVASPKCPMCAEARKGSNPKPDAKPDNKPDSKPVMLDAFGNEVPKRCRDAYADPWVQDSIDFLGIMVSQFWGQRLADGMNKRKKHYPWFAPKDFADGCGFAGNYLDQILTHLKDNRTAGVCPPCEGKGCADCRMSGMVPREVYTKLKKLMGKKS